MDNELPYRTPFSNAPAAVSQTSFEDERNYDTLREQLKELSEQMQTLRTIDAIDVSKSELTVKQQIVANQIAYDILLPIYQALETAVGDVKSKQEQRLYT